MSVTLCEMQAFSRFTFKQSMKNDIGFTIAPLHRLHGQLRLLHKFAAPAPRPPLKFRHCLRHRLHRLIPRQHLNQDHHC